MPFMKRCVILVGHGGVPTDCPPALVSEFKKLEAAARGATTPQLEEADRKLRQWPRTAQTDPYKTGLENIARALRERFPDRLVLEAYNEFCSPSVEEALSRAFSEGARSFTVISTMYTRGGIHSETEIPAILSAFRESHPQASVEYVWPFSMDAVAGFLAGEISRVDATAGSR
jgi:sirohydrochlorin cobaltochelatase